jgi:cysteine desulfurase NifS/selenium donor protein
MRPIYLDYNATTPVDPAVAEAMRPYLLEHFGNPSSSHWYGIQTRKAVEKARAQVAALLLCDPDEIVFTSGGTESNNFAIRGSAFANFERGTHVVTSAIEHPAVMEVCKYLERHGIQVTYLPVDQFGLIDVAHVERAITPRTTLITIMHANNEVGTIQPISEIASLAKRNGIIMHTDAAQSAGKIPTRVDELRVDLLSIAGHKLHAPKGIGALFVRHGTCVEKLLHGADHEQNLRAGTENVLGVVGLGKACELALRDLEENMAHTRKMRDRLHNGLNRELDGVRLNGHPEHRLPNTLSVGFANVEASTLLSEIEGVAASAGAACHSDSVDISPVLAAMKVPAEYAMGTVRFSTGKTTTEADVDQALHFIVDAVRRLQSTAPTAVSLATDAKEIKLTHFTHGLGCACKLRPQILEKILADLPLSQDPKVLVGTSSADDAAVYLLDEQTAIVVTVDFFTPVVDDPHDFGAIAAANALSDVYAMGAKPLLALNIVGFPSNRLPVEVLKRILQGAQDKANEAGVSIVGGHTVDDSEPKYGMVVVGTVDPKKVLTNSNAAPGDAIVLTKPIGVGIISTAIKRGLAEAKTVSRAIQTMSELNRTAADVFRKFPVNSCTDVTGFGLLGHLREMSVSSGVDAMIYLDAVPTIREAWEFATGNIVPGGTSNNLDYVTGHVDWDDTISRTAKLMLCDAQTSGGLLLSLPAGQVEGLLCSLHAGGVRDASHIGDFTKEGEGKIAVRRSR